MKQLRWGKQRRVSVQGDDVRDANFLEHGHQYKTAVSAVYSSAQ